MNLRENYNPRIFYSPQEEGGSLPLSPEETAKILGGDYSDYKEMPLKYKQILVSSGFFPFFSFLADGNHD